MIKATIEPPSPRIVTLTMNDREAALLKSFLGNASMHDWQSVTLCSREEALNMMYVYKQLDLIL